jgi:hypothetical protein
MSAQVGADQARLYLADGELGVTAAVATHRAAHLSPMMGAEQLKASAHSAQELSVELIDLLKAQAAHLKG